MNTIGPKFICGEAKKLSKWVFDASKKMMKTCLRVQYNVAILPIYFIYGGLKYIYECYRSDNPESLEPRSDVIVDAVKKLRNSVVSSMNGISSPRRNNKTNPIALNNGSVTEEVHELNCPYFPEDEEDSKMENSSKIPTVQFLGVEDFSGSDLMWDVPVISAKAKYFAECHKVGRGRKLETARQMLEEYPIHSAMPKTREEYQNLLSLATNEVDSSILSPILEFDYGAQTINLSYSNVNKNLESQNENIALNILETKHRQKQLFVDNDASAQHVKGHEFRCIFNPHNSSQDTLVRCEMVSINRTLGKIQVTCNTLLEGLLNLKENLSKVIFMKEKLARLEFQVDEGKRLLQEVESDRSLMETKLSVLEKLINEEEKYFTDLPYESGFYECEQTGTSGQN